MLFGEGKETESWNLFLLKKSCKKEGWTLSLQCHPSHSKTTVFDGREKRRWNFSCKNSCSPRVEFFFWITFPKFPNPKKNNVKLMEKKWIPEGPSEKANQKILPKRVKEIRHPKENDWSNIGGKERKVNAKDSKKKSPHQFVLLVATMKVSCLETTR